MTVHDDLIEKVLELGRLKGFIGVREYSLKNIGFHGLLDLVWLSKDGHVVCAFEFDSSKTRISHNLKKLQFIQEKLDCRIYHFLIREGKLIPVTVLDVDAKFFFKELERHKLL